MAKRYGLNVDDNVLCSIVKIQRHTRGWCGIVRDIGCFCFVPVLTIVACFATARTGDAAT